MPKRRLVLPFFVIVAAVTLAWWTALQLWEDHETVWNYGFNLVYGIVYAFAGLFAAVAAWRWSKRKSYDARGMWLLAAGLSSFAVAQAIWFVYNLLADIAVPTVSYADVFFVFGSLCLIAGFGSFFFHKYRKDERLRRSLAIRMAVIAAALLAIPAYLFFLIGAKETFFITFNAFYSSSSLLLTLFVLFNILQDRHRSLFPFFAMTLLAAALTGVGDIVFGVRDGFALYWNGDISDGFYAAGALMFLFACAFFIPKDSEREIPENAGAWQVRRRDLVVVSFVLVVAAIVAAHHGEQVYLRQTAVLSEEVGLAADDAVYTLTARIAARAREAEQVARLTAQEPPSQMRASFRNDAALLVDARANSGFYLLLDPNGTVTDVVGIPEAQARALEGKDASADPHLRPWLLSALQGRRTVVSDIETFETGAPGVYIVAPMFDADAYRGAVVYALPLARLFADLDKSVAGQDPEILVLTAAYALAALGEPVAEDDPGTQRLLASWHALSSPVAVGDAEWTLYAKPDDADLRNAETEAFLSFLGALLFGALVTVIVYLLISQEHRVRRELALRTRELDERVRELERFKFFLDNVSDAVLVLDQKGRVLYANREALRQTGFARDELIGRDFRSLFRFVSHGGKRVVQVSLDRGEGFTGEAQIRRDGSETEVFLSVAPYTENDGSSSGTIVAWQDITPLAKAQRAKSEFVSFVAHQLRTPMTQMRWNVELLLEKRVAKDVRELLDELYASVIVENRFVSDLLNLSRIERGVLKLNFENAPIGAVIDIAVSPLERAAKDRGIHLKMPARFRGERVRIDAEKTVEALRNVLDNAVKYTTRKTPVEIGIERTEREIVVTVRDHGTGIPEDAREHLFDIKATGTQTSAGTGAGIGLYLSRKFLEAMGGSIDFRTSSLGTVFSLRLPKAPKSG